MRFILTKYYSVQVFIVTLTFLKKQIPLKIIHLVFDEMHELYEKKTSRFLVTHKQLINRVWVTALSKV